MYHILTILILICLSIPINVFAAETANITSEYVKVPELLNTTTVYMVGKIYKPQGDGPFPLLIITHGHRKSTQLFTVTPESYSYVATTFAHNGFTVLNLVRRGYGKSEGENMENIGTKDTSVLKASIEGAKDVRAAVEFMKTKPYIDETKIVLIGKTMGGNVVMAAATQEIPGVIGVINFGGGVGIQAVDADLVKAYGVYAKESKLANPALWIYTANDSASYFSRELPDRLYDEYSGNGGKANYVMYGKWEKDGHNFLDFGMKAWLPFVNEYFRAIGLNGHITL